MAEAREGSRRATRWTCHGIRVSDDRKTSTTHEHAGPTPATESYWVLTSYHVHVPITRQNYQILRMYYTSMYKVDGTANPADAFTKHHY